MELGGVSQLFSMVINLYKDLLLLFSSFQVNAGAINGWKGLKHFIQKQFIITILTFKV